MDIVHDITTPKPARPTGLGAALLRGWPLVFVGFLVPPIVALLRDGTVNGSVAAAALVVLGAAFAVEVWSMPGWPDSGPADRRRARIAVGFMVAAAAVVATTHPGWALVTLPFLAAALGAVLPLPLAVVAVTTGVGITLAARGADGGYLALAVVVAGLGGAVDSIAGRREAGIRAAEEARARLALHEERARLARDLHDVLGHSLTVIAVKAELAGRLLDIDPARARPEVSDVERLARSALSDVRSAVSGCREVSLGSELAGARHALEAAGVSIRMSSDVERVPADLRELFAWTVREGVTNVVRHARATRCDITITPHRVEVLDDGAGPEAGGAARDRGRDTVAGGAGIDGLRARARAVGAVVTAGPRREGGYRLLVELPRGAGPGRTGRT